MAKISAAGGPSHEGNLQVEPQETYLVDDGDESVTNATKDNPSYVRNGQLMTDEEVSDWDGTKLSESSKSPETSNDKNESESRQPAPNAENPSKQTGKTAKDSASTTDGGTRKIG